VMDWGRERWRKWYVHPTADWLALPISARGLGAELVRIANDDGVIPTGPDPRAALFRLLGGHPTEGKRFRYDLDRLEQTGFITIAKDSCTVANFRCAQENRKQTLSKKRVQAFRERQKTKETPHSDPPHEGDVTHVTRDGNADVTLKRESSLKGTRERELRVTREPPSPPRELSELGRAIRTELEQGRDLYPPAEISDAELDAASERMARSISEEPKAKGEEINVARGAVTSARSFRARHPMSSAAGVLASIETKLFYLLGDVRSRSATKPKPEPGGTTSSFDLEAYRADRAKRLAKQKIEDAKNAEHEREVEEARRARLARQGMA
jgi:hypothetical protein